MDPHIIEHVIVKTSLFKDLEPSDMQAILDISRVLNYPPAEPILETHQPPTGLYLILEGKCRVEVEEEPGSTPDVLAELGPGEIVGDLSFIDGEPVSARVVSMTPVITLYIPLDEFRSLLTTRPLMEKRVLWNLCQSLVSRLRRTNENLVMARRLLIRTIKSFHG